MKKRFTAIYHTDGFANEFTAEGEVGHIRMPYGEYEYGEAECPDGRKRRIVQLWDEASARAVKAALPKEGYPVYQGHPDVPDVAAKYPNKAAIGWITGIEVANDAATLTVEWIHNPGKGFKWFSPYWCGDAEVGDDADTARVHVSQLTSVGLVNNPRIKQFTLANEWGDEGQTISATPEEAKINNQTGAVQMDIAKLAALLGLPAEGVTEEQIAEEITKLQQAAVAAADTAQAATDDATAKVEAANAEAAAQKQAAEEAEQKFANERSARIELMLDNAISAGNITPAGKAAWKERLEKDIEAGALALANEHAVKTQAVVTPAKAEEHNVKGKTLLDFANEKIAASGGKMTFHDAFMRAKTEHPELASK